MRWGVWTHQSAHGSVKSMPVVPPELGVGALERGVTVSLGLLDTAMPSAVALHAVRLIEGHVFHPPDDGARAMEVRDAYPFRWFFFDWLCWDEFLDSAHLR